MVILAIVGEEGEGVAKTRVLASHPGAQCQRSSIIKDIEDHEMLDRLMIIPLIILLLF